MYQLVGLDPKASNVSSRTLWKPWRDRKVGQEDDDGNSATMTQIGRVAAEWPLRSPLSSQSSNDLVNRPSCARPSV